MNLQANITIYAGGPGSGCEGPNCGRKEVYHGTTVERAMQIAKEGIKPGLNGSAVSFASTAKGTALKFAGEKFSEDNPGFFKDRSNLLKEHPIALVVIKNPDDIGMTSPKYGKGYVSTDKPIGPENIDRIEIHTARYDAGSNSMKYKLIKTIKK